MSTLGDYEPAIDTDSLLLKWTRRARESQMSHYDMANLLGRRNRGLGVSVIALTALIGTGAFLSMIATGVSPLVRIVIGLVSVLASVMASLQTFLRYAERAEQHRAAGARYGAIRRRLESIYARSPDTRAAHDFVEIREELDRLAQEVPNVPTDVFIKTQQDMSAGERSGSK
ncbi:hypothetical protein AX768_25775 [Burkholderia sp. PAMC 28687]|uniref:SMODS and SLOG-associating 2TM effector domain-containing protein n=1 Tax=Caballeronia sordidicola TaxID=196367 RepID=A0A242ME89_CABSO|nr:MULTISPECIES: SLATT domain-containing protein [Burkholderiaceae]AMM17597.1 hypothetical protein AX768_25775 [Burkholderia sp. PAMC 28687]OTP69621.1 hypothetical protein PAMC26510_26595 [Caballeronia sordidicola]